MTATIEGTATPRPLYIIAAEIDAKWRSVNFAAEPYLDAMFQLDSITDRYYQDSARTIVQYFLTNARSFTGPDAKRIKAELKSML